MADRAQRAATLTALYGLLACHVPVLADDEVLPDIELLEYLGSWEGSDEDWQVLAAAIESEQVADVEQEEDTAEIETAAVETDDET